VIFVSEFAERSTDAQVRAAAVHRRELLDKWTRSRFHPRF
jgi:hypothetical protein